MTKLIAQDANGTDSSDLTKVFAVYHHLGRELRIQASITGAANIKASLDAAFDSAVGDNGQTRAAINFLTSPLPVPATVAELYASTDKLRQAVVAVLKALE